MDYPKHIYEKVREDVAVNYLSHELKKIFPSIGTEEVTNLMSSEHLAIPRDFWNGFHGVAMGFKLNIGLIYVVTAQNIFWSKETTSVDELTFGVERDDTRLVRSGKLPAKELRDYYLVNEKQRVESLKSYEFRNGETDPITVINGSVYDGNGRLNKFILDGKHKIIAYVGRYITEEKIPKNYWLPTSLIMDNLFFVYQAIRENNEEMFNTQIKALKYMVQNSESGKFELENRAITSREPERTKILTALQNS